MSYEQNSVSELREMLVQTGKFTPEETLLIKGKANLVFELKKLGVENPLPFANEFDDVFAEAEMISEGGYVDEKLEQLFQEKVKAEPQKVYVEPSKEFLYCQHVDSEGNPIYPQNPPPSFFLQENTSVSGNTYTEEDKYQHIDNYKSPKITDPEWQDYVLSYLQPNELQDGHPKVCGLRRLAELLLGEVVFSSPIQVFAPTDVNGPGRATVVYQIRIAWKHGVEEWLDMGTTPYPERTFGGVADSYIGNTDANYAVYPSAIAETRAEGRALRKALRLDVIAYEEKTENNVVEIVEKAQEIMNQDNSGWNPEDSITLAQMKSIEKLCERLGIDVVKFINSGSKQYESIEDVSKTVAKKMIGELNKFQSETDSSKPIPDKLKLVVTKEEES